MLYENIPEVFVRLIVSQSGNGEMYVWLPNGISPVHSGVVVCLEVLLNLEGTCCYNDGGGPTAEVDRQILQTTLWCFIPKG